MIAAVLHEAKGVPRAEEFADPQGAPLVKVLAAGLHPLVRAVANGSHYTSPGKWPLIPGVDGVGELPDGKRVYFGWPKAPYGTFAQTAAIEGPMLPLPPSLDPRLAAAIVNPAMSGWFALRLRAKMDRGEKVLILGATGAAGQLAVQVARALDAGRVVACGRNAEVLASLKADATLQVNSVHFADELANEIAVNGVHVVLDYLWGPPAETTLTTILAQRTKLGRVRYVNIGEMAGHHIQLSPHVLRSMPLELLGSGIGSVSRKEMFEEIPGILEETAKGKLRIDFEPVPLAKVDEAWATPAERGRRVVIVP